MKTRQTCWSPRGKNELKTEDAGRWSPRALQAVEWTHGRLTGPATLLEDFRAVFNSILKKLSQFKTGKKKLPNHSLQEFYSNKMPSLGDQIKERQPAGGEAPEMNELYETLSI
ncbi:uncharacterized protein LOC135351418 [Halichondria panicea]|uniref:uncharacterized protein LOC135351418 n=1 Tax=Halichondria panicea TaxID=6063 RepID=UPI00312B8054